MPMNTIIGRTERVRKLKALLQEKQVVYLSAFYCAGKTVLLDQLAKSLEGTVLRFEMGRDDWNVFQNQAQDTPKATLLIDSLHRLDDATAQSLASLIAKLDAGQCVVMAGRAQLPTYLRQLCATNVITVLDKDFVLMDEEEIIQLFLEYGVNIKPEDASWLKQNAWGWPISLHITAKALARDPERNIRETRAEVAKELSNLLIQDVVTAFPDTERSLLYNLSPFQSFTEEMARMVTGRVESPKLMREIAQKSYMLLQEKNGSYAFIPFVRNTLFNEMKNNYTEDYIRNQYRRAALYHELQGNVTEAVKIYMTLWDTEKIKELLIRDTHLRPSNGEYVELKPAYNMLTTEEIKSSPELMKGMCMIEGLSGHVNESERWYSALKTYIDRTPSTDANRRIAQEAVAYLDIALPYRGTGDILRTLVSTAKLSRYTDSKSWRSGFNVAGNSVSLMNGGKDFSRWNPHGRNLYRLFKTPVELALGRGGSGMADIAIGECLLESSLDGDYTEAWSKVSLGITRAADDLEMHCAATGIQARIIMAQGDVAAGAEMLKNQLDSLPESASARLRQNLRCAWLTMELMQGRTGEALTWLSAEAPDETKTFNILDRYRYMLKLRLYIITGAWVKTQLLINRLSDYFEHYQRPYMRVQLYLLQALIDKRTGKDTWKDKLAQGLCLAKRYKLARVIADEGIAVLDMLSHLKGSEEPWERGVLNLVRAQAARYPGFMQSIAQRPTLSDREYQVYSLKISGMSNAKIAEMLSITERAVKYHVTEIFRKMGVKTHSELMKKAFELGDIH
ncbi:MAG: hypothetical protein IJ089_08110 [Clostridia bacterium]|nr:hypothetical protein [Clostridia bacterium]